MQESLPLTLQRFLVASYAYYIENASLMPDEEYDCMAKRLLDGWDTFEHRHKHLISIDDLSAGTAFHLKSEDYPAIVVGAARAQMKQQCKKNT